MVGQGLSEKSPFVDGIARRSVGERLEEEAALLRSRLLDLEAAIAALKSNPEVEQIINLVSKVQDNRY